MKWIDDQDDYFLRDFNSKNDGDTDSSTQGSASSPSQAPGQSGDTTSRQGDTAASDGTPGNASGSAGSTPGEFTFPASSTGGSDSASTTGGNDGYVTADVTDPADSPRRKRRRARRRLFWFFLILLIVLGTAFYIRYFVPYTSETLTTGYITLVEKRGIFFKTFEGEMISESVLADTAKVYSRDFYFSIPDDSLGRLVQSYQGTGKRVTLTTQKYYGTLPWRGSQKSVVTAVTPAAN